MEQQIDVSLPLSKINKNNKRNNNKRPKIGVDSIMWARDQERIYQGSDQSYHSEEVGTLKTRSVNKPKGVLYGL